MHTKQGRSAGDVGGERGGLVADTTGDTPCTAIAGDVAVGAIEEENRRQNIRRKGRQQGMRQSALADGFHSVEARRADREKCFGFTLRRRGTPATRARPAIWLPLTASEAPASS